MNLISGDEWTVEDFNRAGKRIRRFKVNRSANGFGIGFVGPTENERDQPDARLYVTTIEPGSYASSFHNLKVGCRILEINEIYVGRATQAEAIGIIQDMGTEDPGAELKLATISQPERFKGFMRNLCPACFFARTDKDKFCPKCGQKLELLVADPWELKREQVAITVSLGQGNFGEVFRGEFRMQPDHPPTLVAVKTCKPTNKQANLFLAEAIKMKNWSHTNIVRLYGMCSGLDGPLWIVLELVQGGGLVEYMRSKHGKSCTPAMHCSMLRDVAEGMNFMANSNWVHLDLALRNLLIDTSAFNMGAAKFPLVKVCDFGLAMQVKDAATPAQIPRGVPLPVRWVSPEVWFTKTCSPAADIWSYGRLARSFLSLSCFCRLQPWLCAMLSSGHLRLGNRSQAMSGMMGQSVCRALSKEISRRFLSRSLSMLVELSGCSGTVFYRATDGPRLVCGVCFLSFY